MIHSKNRLQFSILTYEWDSIRSRRDDLFKHEKKHRDGDKEREAECHLLTTKANNCVLQYHLYSIRKFGMCLQMYSTVR